MGYPHLILWKGVGVLSFYLSFYLNTFFYLSRFIVFWKENILVLDGDKFIEDPVPVLKRVERFLRKALHLTLHVIITIIFLSVFPRFTRRPTSHVQVGDGQPHTGTDCLSCRQERISLLQPGWGHHQGMYGQRKGKRPPGDKAGNCKLSAKYLQTNVGGI